VEGRLLIHRGFTGHACRPHEKSGLAAFFEKQKMQAGLDAEEKLFKQLMTLSTKPASAFPRENGGKP